MKGIQVVGLVVGVGVLLVSTLLVWWCPPSGTVLMSLGLVLAQLAVILVPLHHPRALAPDELPP